jgi:peptidoglycan/LPS O-acetylase OafA/YrhL
MNAAYAVGGSIIAGLASYFLIEKPTRQWINQRWQSKTLS